MGGMKGEMKMAKSLYLKDFATPDGRDGAFSDNNCKIGGTGL
jgi:hypothetical protein